MENYGIKMHVDRVSSCAEDTPMIWRGPMVMSALNQMLRDVDVGRRSTSWSSTCRPAPATRSSRMAQQVPLAGAVIVSTPQDIALIDARKGLTMFRKVDVPVLGIVENMSYFLCPHCGERSEIFSHGGARREAEQLGVRLPRRGAARPGIRETSDEGRPITMSDPGSAHAQLFREIAAQVWEKVSGDGMRRAPPRIVVE